MPKSLFARPRAHLTSFMRGFIKRTDGVAAVEFALIVPIMAVMFIGSVEMSQAITANRRVTMVASMNINHTTMWIQDSPKAYRESKSSRVVIRSSVRVASSKAGNMARASRDDSPGRGLGRILRAAQNDKDEERLSWSG